MNNRLRRLGSTLKRSGKQPGFQFIQDPLEYSTRTHHSNLDDATHVVAADLMQASAIIASLVYHAANREAMLPRKPLPDALPPRRE